MEARLIYLDPQGGVEEVLIGGHSIEFGPMGDSYCHQHGSSECVSQLTDAEVAKAEELLSCAYPVAS